jgi:hypothetical protein
MDTEQKKTISERALFERCRRRLALSLDAGKTRLGTWLFERRSGLSFVGGERLRIARVGNVMQLGVYYAIDEWGIVTMRNVDLWRLGRDLGVLGADERHDGGRRFRGPRRAPPATAPADRRPISRPRPPLLSIAIDRPEVA